MSDDLLTWFLGPVGLEQLYTILWLTTGTLLLASLGFGVVAIRLRLGNMKKEARWRALEERWEPVILGVLWEDRPVADLHSLVGPDDRLYFLSFLLRYVERLRGRERSVARSLAGPYLSDLVRLISKGPPESRARAVRTVAELGIPEYAPELVRALDDDSPLVAMVAARSLFVRDLPEHLPEVLARLDRFDLWSTGFLTGMLVQGGDPAVPLLRGTLAGDGDPALRAVAAKALGRLHDIESAEVAADLLRSTQHTDLVIACLGLLAAVGTSAHVEAVRPWVNADDDAVRAKALGALASLGGRDDIQMLRDHASDRSTWVALEATRGLLRVGGRDEVETLLDEPGRRATVAAQVLAE